jgi:hypothetical protein
MNKVKTGWKLLYRWDGTAYMSAIVGGVCYEPGHWARPSTGCGPLAVFCSRRRLLEFLAYHGIQIEHRHMAKCKYEPSRYRKLWLRSFLSPNNKDIKNADCLPRGTRLARRVMIAKPRKVREYMLTPRYRRSCHD